MYATHTSFANYQEAVWRLSFVATAERKKGRKLILPSTKSHRRASLIALEKSPEVGCRTVQWHGVEQFEAAGEGVLERIGRPWTKFLMSGLAPIPPNFPCQVLRGVELVFDERLEDGKPCLVVRDLDLLPGGDLDLHWLES